MRPLTPANRSLRFLETGLFAPPQINAIGSRAAVPGMSIASMDLLSHIEPLPVDRLLLYEVCSVREWPSADRDQLIVVVHSDIHVARHNVAEMTSYLYLDSAQLSACAGAMDDTLPLMTVETFPREGVVLDSLP